jgi:hypothetical protein
MNRRSSASCSIVLMWLASLLGMPPGAAARIQNSKQLGTIPWHCRQPSPRGEDGSLASARQTDGIRRGRRRQLCDTIAISGNTIVSFARITEKTLKRNPIRPRRVSAERASGMCRPRCRLQLESSARYNPQVSSSAECANPKAGGHGGESARWILDVCEAAARAEFRAFEMAATLSGVPFYGARGYTALESVDAPLAEAGPRDPGASPDRS